MAVKTYPDWENIFWHLIPPHPQKHMNIINMHRHRGKTIPPMPPPIFWYDARTGGVYQSKKNCNWPGKWSPQGKVMGCNRNKITPQTPTQGGCISSRVRPTTTGIITGSWHRTEGSFNGWIHWWHHHHHHWLPNMGGAHQKLRIIGNTHHIQATTFLRTTETGRPPSNTQTISRR